MLKSTIPKAQRLSGGAIKKETNKLRGATVNRQCGRTRDPANQDSQRKTVAKNRTRAPRGSAHIERLPIG